MTKLSADFIRNLTGHSGCDISLYSNNGSMFVRKKSKDIEYNKRLKLQYIKQLKFEKENFSVPKILSRGVDSEGIFFFDMEFINGQSLSNYFSLIKMNEIPRIIDFLFKNLPIENSNITGNSHKIISNKIIELDNSLSVKTSNVRSAIDRLKEYNFSNIPEGECHGDLTLENIMISKENEIYLIDFLDSFFNSWVIDIAKILQDVHLLWSYRHRKIDANLEMRLLVAKEEIISQIIALKNGNRILCDIYHVLMLNILRIYPYTKDNETLFFLDEALSKVSNQIDGNKNEYSDYALRR